MRYGWDGIRMVRNFIMVCWVGWEQLRNMVWYGAGIRKLGDGDGMVTGGGTEIKVSIPSHPIPIPFLWEYHPNTFLPRKGLKKKSKRAVL